MLAGSSTSAAYWFLLALFLWSACTWIISNCMQSIWPAPMHIDDLCWTRRLIVCWYKSLCSRLYRNSFRHLHTCLFLHTCSNDMWATTSWTHCVAHAQLNIGQQPDMTIRRQMHHKCYRLCTKVLHFCSPASALIDVCRHYFAYVVTIGANEWA